MQIQSILNININKNNTFQKNKYISFQGLSDPKHYETTIDYLAAKIVSAPKAKYQLPEDKCSANKIKRSIDMLLKGIDLFKDYPKSYLSRIKWASHLPEYIRKYAVDRANVVRETRFAQWGNVLNNPDNAPELVGHDKLIQKIKKLKAPLKIVVWNAITSELSEYNKHTPVPFDAKTFEETIDDFESFSARSRKIRCNEIPFIKMYTHRLRDNVLESLGLSNNDAVWVKIPSLKNDPKNSDTNIANTEILSHVNWCTRSSQYKAVEVLKRGNFYINLVRDNNGIWEPKLCVVTNKNGKVEEIQSGANNDFIPLDQIKNIEEFLKSKNLRLDSGIDDSGPKAYEQMAIANKLAEKRMDVEQSFFYCIKNNNAMGMLKYLGYEPQLLYTLDSSSLVNILADLRKNLPTDINFDKEYINASKNEEHFKNYIEDLKIALGKLIAKELQEKPCEITDIERNILIKNYKPEYFDSKIKRVIPYYLFGINEDDLLKDVSIIEGNMILFNPKRKGFASRITVFPPKLNSVDGKIICNFEQFKKFKDDMYRVVHSPSDVVVYCKDEEGKELREIFGELSKKMRK